MWPFSGPNQKDRELAERLLRQAILLQQQAALLLGLRGVPQARIPDPVLGSTSSPPSIGSSSPTSSPRIRGAESVTVLDRETLLKQDLETQRRLRHPPEPSIETGPRPSGEPGERPKPSGPTA